AALAGRAKKERSRSRPRTREATSGTQAPSRGMDNEDRQVFASVLPQTGRGLTTSDKVSKCQSVKVSKCRNPGGSGPCFLLRSANVPSEMNSIARYGCPLYSPNGCSRYHGFCMVSLACMQRITFGAGIVGTGPLRSGNGIRILNKPDV